MKRLSHILLIFTALIFSGCMSLYTPTTPNTPLFKTKNEFQAEGSFFLNGFNVKTAYTPLNHLAFQLNGHYGEIAYNNRYHKYAEAALGYYYGFKNGVSIECYGGYGKGASSFPSNFLDNESSLHHVNGDYEKYYLQLNVGNRQLWRNGGTGFCMRVANVRYTYSDANFKNMIGKTIDHYALEPYWFMHLNIAKQWDFTLHAGLTFIDAATFYPQPTMRTNVINIGTGFKYWFGWPGKKAKSEKTTLKQ